MAGVNDILRNSDGTFKTLNGDFVFGEQNLFMKYPMNAYYQSVNGTDYIADQASAFASAITNLPEGSTSEEINDWFESDMPSAEGWEIIPPERIHFDWDERTAREAEGGNPTYLMSIWDESGNLVPTGFRFSPDPLYENAKSAIEAQDVVAQRRMAAKLREEAKSEALTRAQEMGF